MTRALGVGAFILVCVCVCAFARDVVEFKSSVGFDPGVGMRSSGLFLQTKFGSKSNDVDDDDDDDDDDDGNSSSSSTTTTNNNTEKRKIITKSGRCTRPLPGRENMQGRRSPAAGSK